MESQVFDIVKFEKQKAVEKFNRFRRVVKLWQIFECLVVFGVISWSSARVPAVSKATAARFVEFSTYLFNHHVVFLIGNAIIVLLVVLCRQNDAVAAGGDDFYDDYVKHSEAANPRQPPMAEIVDAPPEEKQIVVCYEETKEVAQCDDVSAAIEEATKQIRRFQRTQSEKLKREIAVRPQAELRRSETENNRKIVSSGAAEIETLSSEEFRRTVDAFIDKHWSKKKTKQNQFEKYQLMNENVKSVRLQA
ncbi:hypothetical protein BUALT_Bualt08G0073800 [Buddleja alternifolia]|uniref:Uncharacterized protein n=1 Tax=Buddleja alternifolia TaxID=168488 RepID=A0AAV6XCG9_9LAMI|nr:hypothetical protein BUALT_Bualt08G0073800 [Buddleja alternifolia]